jgi:hypothetical protein
MTKDDMKEQIPLFYLPMIKKEEKIQPVKKLTKKLKEKDLTVKSRTENRKIETESISRTKVEKKKTKHGPAKITIKIPISGQVPEGDVRLTANIRDDLHLKLKIAAARRRTTIGELLEELVEKYL